MNGSCRHIIEKREKIYLGPDSNQGPHFTLTNYDYSYKVGTPVRIRVKADFFSSFNYLLA